MSKIEIYYFSGTGNSFYAAKFLVEKLPDATLHPIARLIKTKEVRTNAAVVGFVFPVHLSTIPIFILDFIKKINLDSAQYIFSVATRVGTQHSSFSQLNKVLKKKNKKLQAFTSVNMPSNDPKFGFKVKLSEDMERQRVIVDKKLLALVEAIKLEKDFKEKDNDYTTRVPLVNVLAGLVKLTDNMQQKFYADEKCAGCGTCAQVCPSGKIIMKEGKPVWQKEVKCFKCYACLNFCPQQAVHIKGYTEGKGRYSHPYATADDISNQK